MAEYCNSCNSCGASYVASMPQQNYVLNSQSAHYTFKTNPGDAYYDDSPIMYSAPSRIETKTANEDTDVIQLGEPRKALAVIEPSPIQSMNTLPIESMIENLMPQGFMQQNAMFPLQQNAIMPSEIMPINEIERAIDRIVRVQHLEIEEEIIIRRRIRKQDVIFKS